MVKIISDSTTDLGNELIEKHNIQILPLNVLLGEKNYKDGVDITPEEIYEYHDKNGVLPKTAALNIADFENIFADASADGSDVVCFTISSKMSATFNNARIAAENFNNVYAIDTCNLSTGGGLLVLEACKMAQEGKSGAEIKEKCDELAKYIDASFVIDSLEYLHKGGRCSAVAAFGANLLKLKPLIQVSDGVMGVAKKYRGKFDTVLLEYTADKLANVDDIDTENVFITHAGVDDEYVESVKQRVLELIPFKNVYITRASATISSHCGRNTLGVLFKRKSPVK